jgi:hypothetical protein
MFFIEESARGTTQETPPFVVAMIVSLAPTPNPLFSSMKNID